MGIASSRNEDVLHPHRVELVSTDTTTYMPGYENQDRGFLGKESKVNLSLRHHSEYKDLVMALLIAHGISPSDVQRIRVTYCIATGTVQESNNLFEVNKGTPLKEIIILDKVKFVLRILEWTEKAMKSQARKPADGANSANPQPHVGNPLDMFDTATPLEPNKLRPDLSDPIVHQLPDENGNELPPVKKKRNSKKSQKRNHSD